MKKLFGLVMTVMMSMSLLVSPVKAATPQNVDDNWMTSAMASNIYVNNVSKQDALSIISLKNEIEDFIAKVFEAEGITLDVESNIEYGQLMKCYNGSDFWNIDKQNESDFISNLDEDGYFYVLYVSVGDYKIVVDIVKRSSVSSVANSVLSDIELNQLQSTIGEWSVTSVGIVTAEDVCYDEELTKYVNEYENIMLINEIDGLEYPVFLGLNSDQSWEVIPIYSNITYPVFASQTALQNAYCMDELENMVCLYKENLFVEMASSILYENIVNAEQENASAYSYTILTIPKREQEKSNWCWAACAQMVGKYASGSLKSQTSIVTYVKGAPDNKSATVEETRVATQYAIGSNYTAHRGSVISLSNFEYYIGTKSHPCIILVSWNGSTTSGHYYVVSGVNGSTICLIDPLPDHITKWYSYSALVAGTTLEAGYGNYTNTVMYV